MKTITVINAHGQGIAAFRRHKKYWHPSGDEALVVSPENDPIEDNWGHRILCGQAQHNGRESWKRFQRIIAELKTREWDWCVMHEYDSFCLDPKLPSGPGFYGVLWPNDESPKFLAIRYANPPWTFDRMSFMAMAEKAEKYPSIYELGEADRYWSALAELSGVPVLNYDPPGYSRGTIDHQSIPLIKKAIHEGAYAIHGVKQEWVLKAIEEFWGERPNKS